MRMMRGKGIRRSLLAAALLTAAALAACEPDDGTPAADTGADTTTSAVTAGEMPELVVEAKDFSYVAPAEVAAGLTKVTMKNEGQDLHEVGLYYLEDGKAFEDFASAMDTMGDGPPPAWIVPAGGPGAAPPGGSSSAFVDLKPGYYVMLCPIPDAEGKPHFELGMIRPLRVVDNQGPSAAAPAADLTVKATDFAFGEQSEVAAGQHVINFENSGQQPHEMILVKLNEGATVQEVAAAFAPGGDGQPPALPMGGVAELAAGESQSFPVDLTPGRYGLLCFLTDQASGKAHVELGMMAEFEAK